MHFLVVRVKLCKIYNTFHKLKLQNAKLFLEDFKYNTNPKYMLANVSISSVQKGIKLNVNLTQLLDYSTALVSNSISIKY